MRRLATGLATAATLAMAVGPAFGQGAPVVVGEAPVHAVPDDASAAQPVEADAPPNTLNAQYASLAARKAAAPAPAQADGPAVAIAPSLIDAAGSFEAYLRKAGGIDPKFTSGAAVAKAVITGSSYEQDQFQEGMIAYAALAALQEPAFVQSVFDLGRDSRDRQALAAQLLQDPQMVLAIDGADVAADSVGQILAHMGASLITAGQGVKQSSYDVQKQPWSKEAAANPQERLAETKKISAARTALNADDTTALIQTVVALRKAGDGVGGRRSAPTAVVARGLALAALAVLGRAGEEDAASLEPLLHDGKSADCMKMAKLNLYQCLAVAGPHYEHVYCLGQHALMDTGQCVVSAAGQSLAPATLQNASAPPPPRSRSVSVPIALGSVAGPERARAYARPPAASDDRPAAPPAAPDQMAAVAPGVYRDEQADRADIPPPRAGARDEEPYFEDRAPPRARAQRDERDDRYDRYDPYRGLERYPQDYDPYVERYGPPELAYRYRR